MSRRVTLKFKTGPLAGKSFSLGPGEYFLLAAPRTVPLESKTIQLSNQLTQQSTTNQLVRSYLKIWVPNLALL